MSNLFVHKISGGNERLYEITIPQADGQTAYFKLSVDRLKESLFHKACDEGSTIDLNEYGEILESYFLPTKIEKMKEDVVY